MAKRGENIYKRKDGRWEGRFIKGYDLSGKAQYGYVYAHSYADVKEKLNQKRGGSLLQCGNSERIVYQDLITAWLNSLQINIKESTYARYYHLAHSHIIPRLGKYKVDRITNRTIEEYIAFLMQNGRIDGSGGLSQKTVSDIFLLIKRSMEYALQSGYRTSCNLTKMSIKIPKKESRVLSQPEQEKLLCHLTADTDRTKLGILICLYTGIRIGELCALKWEHFNFEIGILMIRQTMLRIQDINSNSKNKTKLIITQPKSTCSVRDIPIPNFLLFYIKQFVGSSSDFILTGANDKFIEPRTMQNRFHTCTKTCGIRQANFHSLRHTFATRCVEIGFETKSLSEILGHANVNITLNRYVHSSLDLKRNNMAKLDALVYSSPSI